MAGTSVQEDKPVLLRIAPGIHRSRKESGKAPFGGAKGDKHGIYALHQTG